MYKVLSYNKSKRRIFSEGRRTLIVDEEIDIVEHLHYNNIRISIFRKLLPESLKGLYNICIKDLENKLCEVKGKDFIYLECTDLLDRQLKKFKKLLKNEITKEFIINNNEKLNLLLEQNELEYVKYNKIEFKKGFFLDEINKIREFYCNPCIVDSNNIHTFNSKIQYWLLENNILLDANAGFNACYSLSDKFQVSRQTRIVDHSRWTLHICNENTTNNAKGKYLNFEEQIQNFVFKNLSQKDKFLTITSKEEEEKLNSSIEGVDFAHFGNLIGKNDWINYNKLLIPHTPNLPFYVYILKYLYYSGLKPDGRYKHNIITKDGVAVFANAELDEVRKTYLVGELYQAIKRIDRDVKFDSDIYLINNDSEVISSVVKQLRDVNVAIFDLELEQQPKVNGGYNNEKRRENSYPVKFLRLLKSSDYGEYTKSWIMEQILYNDKSNFAKDILGDDEVKKYLNENPHISIKTRKIIISNGKDVTGKYFWRNFGKLFY